MADTHEREGNQVDKQYESPDLFELGSAEALILGSSAESGESSLDGGKCD